MKIQRKIGEEEEEGKEQKTLKDEINNNTNKTYIPVIATCPDNLLITSKIWLWFQLLLMHCKCPQTLSETEYSYTNIYALLSFPIDLKDTILHYLLI